MDCIVLQFGESFPNEEHWERSLFLVYCTGDSSAQSLCSYYYYYYQ